MQLIARTKHEPGEPLVKHCTLSAPLIRLVAPAIGALLRGTDSVGGDAVPWAFPCKSENGIAAGKVLVRSVSPVLLIIKSRARWRSKFSWKFNHPNWPLSFHSSLVGRQMGRPRRFNRVKPIAVSNASHLQNCRTFWNVTIYLILVEYFIVGGYIKFVRVLMSKAAQIPAGNSKP